MVLTQATAIVVMRPPRPFGHVSGATPRRARYTPFMLSSATDALLSELEGVAEAALLHEALGKRGALNHDVKPAYAGAKLLGRALTIRGCQGDNLMLHQAISIAQPGDVLVATVYGYCEAGIWGEIATIAAQMRVIR